MGEQAAMRTIGQLHLCDTPEALSAATTELVRELGGKAFVYSTHVKDEQSPDQFSQRHCISSHTEWLDIYNERKWFMNDPFIEYARYNTRPAYGSEIAVHTQGQREMLRVAAQFGFRSGLLIPTHSSINVDERIGMLIVGSDQDGEKGEQILTANRICFRALAMELLDWWVHYLRDKAALRYRLSPDEIQLLQLSKSGCVVADISVKLNIKPSKLYRQFDAIKDKLNVLKIGDAVRLANRAGLLG